MNKKEGCKWKYADGGIWEASCRDYPISLNKREHEFWYKYCPLCGNKIVREK